MEGNDLSPQNPPRELTRPQFVPKQPPRRRQRGVLPPLNEQQQGVSAEHPLTSQVRVTEQATASQQECFSEDQKSTLLPPAELQLPPQHHVASSMHPMEDSSMQIGYLSQQRGHTPKRQKTAQQQTDVAGGAVKLSRSWHRVSAQEQPHLRGALRPPDGPRQKGIILTPQESLQAPSLPHTDPPLLQGLPATPPLIAQNPGTSYPLLQTKASFIQMWNQLEAAIQSREGMLMNMKAEMEKCLSSTKNAKVNAVKEKEEVEARKVEVKRNFESTSKQTGRIKGVREGLEQISTDLSVQVAELNLLLQHAQELQRVLGLLESLKEHYDVSGNENRNYMDKSLQECEGKLATMEKELDCSKRTSEVLEKAVTKKLDDLAEIGAGDIFSEAHTNAQTSQTLSKMRTLTRPPSEHRELLKHAAVLKVPKLEPC